MVAIIRAEFLSISKMKRAHILLSGRVQGVWFRANTKEKAEQLDLKGWVRNLSNGRVEIVFEGKKEVIEKAIEWCHHGPSFAKVKKVEIKWKEPEGYEDFKVLY